MMSLYFTGVEWLDEGKIGFSGLHLQAKQVPYTIETCPETLEEHLDLQLNSVLRD